MSTPSVSDETLALDAEALREAVKVWWRSPAMATTEDTLASVIRAYLAQSRRAEPSPAGVRAYPDDMTPQLRDVLRLMNFRTVPIAHALRAGGADIPPKTEEEQAYVLHWMIKLALDHPETWHDMVGARLNEIAQIAQNARAAKEPSHD